MARKNNITAVICTTMESFHQWCNQRRIIRIQPFYNRYFDSEGEIYIPVITHQVHMKQPLNGIRISSFEDIAFEGGYNYDKALYYVRSRMEIQGHQKEKQEEKIKRNYYLDILSKGLEELRDENYKSEAIGKEAALQSIIKLLR